MGCTLPKKPRSLKTNSRCPNSRIFSWDLGFVRKGTASCGNFNFWLLHIFVRIVGRRWVTEDAVSNLEFSPSICDESHDSLKAVSNLWKTNGMSEGTSGSKTNKNRTLLMDDVEFVGTWLFNCQCATDSSKVGNARSPSLYTCFSGHWWNWECFFNYVNCPFDQHAVSFMFNMGLEPRAGVTNDQMYWRTTRNMLSCASGCFNGVHCNLIAFIKLLFRHSLGPGKYTSYLPKGVKRFENNTGTYCWQML